MSAFFFVLLYFSYVCLKKAIAKVRHSFRTIILAYAPYNYVYIHTVLITVRV